MLFIIIISLYNHKLLVLYCIIGTLLQLFGICILEKYFYTDHPCEYSKCSGLQLNSFFPFLFSLVIVISFHFMYFITDELLKIGKKDSSSIGISTPCMFQRVQKVVFQGGTKITYDFFSNKCQELYLLISFAQLGNKTQPRSMRMPDIRQ